MPVHFLLLLLLPLAECIWFGVSLSRALKLGKICKENKTGGHGASHAPNDLSVEI